MSPSPNRSQTEAAARFGPPDLTAAPDPELLTVAQELGAIFAKSFAGATPAEASRARPRRPIERAVFSGPGRSHGRRSLIIAGVGAGLLGLCLGALMEKTALLSKPQTSDGAAIAAVALAPTPLPSTPSVQNAAPPAALAPAGLSTPEPSPGALASEPASLGAAAFAPSIPAGPSAPRVAAPAPSTSAAATRPPARGSARKPLRLAMLAAAPLRADAPPPATTVFPPAAAPPSAAGSHPVAPPAARSSGPMPGPSRPAPWGAVGRCDGSRICGPSPAVLQADSRLRQAYSAAARAGVNPHLLEAFRQNWAEMRYALSNQPPQLLNGYRQLTESLWQARRSMLSGQDEEPGYDGSERDYGGPPE